MYVVETDSNKNVLLRTIGWIIIIVIIVIAIYFAVRYIVLPAARGELFNIPVACDTAPPSPTNLTVNVQGNRAYVQWNKSKITDSYMLYVSRVPNSTLSGAERQIKVLDTSIVVLNLLPLTYYFKVASVNRCGTSFISEEVAATIAAYPDVFKLCKNNDPTLCLNVSITQNDPVFIQNSCTEDNCFLAYNNNRISRVDTQRCIYSTNDTPIESGVIGKTCSDTTPWNIDLTSGRISNDAGYCLGADNVNNLQAYNTQCSLLSNNDPRYSWVVQPVNN